MKITQNALFLLSTLAKQASLRILKRLGFEIIIFFAVNLLKFTVVYLFSNSWLKIK
jgi:hypothetical protein